MTTNQDHTTMIKEFRVLAIPKESKCYETEQLKLMFGIDNPVVESVDTLPPNAVINLITNSGWSPAVQEAIPMSTHICIPFVK